MNVINQFFSKIIKKIQCEISLFHRETGLDITYKRDLAFKSFAKEIKLNGLKNQGLAFLEEEKIETNGLKTGKLKW